MSSCVAVAVISDHNLLGSLSLNKLQYSLCPNFLFSSSLLCSEEKEGMEGGRRRTGVLGLEGGRIWFPSHVINVACNPVLMDSDSSVVDRRGTGAFLPIQHDHIDISPTNTRNLHCRRPEPSAGKRSSGGPGVHAVFIDSRPRSRGTGFFLPRCCRDNHVQRSKNPICSPVLTSRVVQVLNLKKHVVHPPITIIKEKEDSRHYSSTTGISAAATKDRDDVEVLLPEEWSY